jgi:TolB protein
MIDLGRCFAFASLVVLLGSACASGSSSRGDAGTSEDASSSSGDGSASDVNGLDGTVADAAGLDAMVTDFGPGPRARIGFTSRRSGCFKLYLMELDGENVEPLTSGPGDDLYVSWSSDARSIVFSSTRTGKAGIYALDLVSRRTSTVTLELENATAPAISPDGRRIAFEGQTAGPTFDLYTVSSTGGRARKLTDDPANEGGAAWSIDGRTIFFVSNRENARFEIYAMDPDGQNVRKLTDGSKVLGRPAVNPDGKSLAFASGDEMTPVRIERLDLESRAITPLSDDDAEEPAYAPDGRYLVFSSQRFGDPEIMILDLTGSGASPIRVTMDPAIDGTPAISPPF